MSRIRFEIVPNGKGQLVKGYVDDELVAQVSASDPIQASQIAQRWKAATEKNAEAVAKMAHAAKITHGGSIRRKGGEEKMF